MASVCTPVSVVTGLEGTLPHGTTVSAFTSLSMDPPMVLVALGQSSELLALVRRTRRYGINVLSSGEAHVARRFAGKGGSAKYAGVPWEPEAGVPRVPGAGGFLACEVADLVPGGDHLVVLGRVVAARTTA